MLVNCVFSGNHADFAAAVHNHVSNTSLFNCTISGNAARACGGVASWYSDPVLKNTILWGNWDQDGSAQTAQIKNTSGSASVDYCCIQGWTGSLGGTGNSGDNPLLVHPDGPDGLLGTLDDDLRVRSGSPVIDHGLTSAVPVDLADIDGDGDTAEPLPVDIRGLPRVLGSAVDIGAYEYRSPVPGDFDGDGDVDQSDFGHMQACLSGSGNAQNDPACQDAKLDGDDSVSDTDMSVFLGCFSGPGVLGDPNCAN